MKTVPVSATMVTLNEAGNVERCLDSLRWADEILVVDSGSEDGTVEIARSMGARTVHHDWPGMGEQKAHATSLAKYDWIFSIDADEAVSPRLAQSILRCFDPSPPAPRPAFEVDRRSNYLGRWMRWGSWGSDRLIRLFHRKSASWEGKDPHARLVPDGPVERLEGPLLHWPYDDLEDQIEHANRYSTTMAREKNHQGEDGGVWKGFSHGAFLFLRDYCFRLGFLDGTRGFLHCSVAAFYTFLKYVKLLELQETR